MTTQIRTRAAVMTSIAVGWSATGARAGFVTAPAPPPGLGVAATLAGLDGEPAHPDRWFADADDGSIRTNWANQRITYEVDLGRVGAVALGVTAMNRTSLRLPPGYDAFLVDVLVDDEFVGALSIGASETEWRTGWVDLGEHAGVSAITLNWRNDAYRRGVYDANIAIGALSLAAPAVPSPVIPTSGTGGLACLSLALATGRRRRRQAPPDPSPPGRGVASASEPG